MEIDLEKEELALFYLYNRVLFPNCTVSFRTKSRYAKDIKTGDAILALPVRNLFDIIFSKNRIATFSEVINIQHDKSGNLFHLKGICRAKLLKVIKFRKAEYEVPDVTGVSVEGDLISALRKKSQQLIFLINVRESDKLIRLLNFINDVSQLADFIANYFVIRFPERLRLFKEFNLIKRTENLISVLNDLIKQLKDKQFGAEG